MSSHDDSHRDHSHEDGQSHSAGHSHGTHEHPEKAHGHPHGHEHGGGALGHTHGPIDPTILTTSHGIWAVKWSFIGLMATAVIQVVIVYYSGRVPVGSSCCFNRRIFG